METNNESARVALFLDVENLVIEAQKAALAFRLELLLDFAREAGILSFARGYADWNSTTISPLLQQFQSNAVQMEQLSTSRGKNTADLQLSLDALEMGLLPHAPDIVIVAGGDRDFVPLVQKLRRYGIRVVGIGVEGASSRCLAQVCDEFVYYDSLVRPEAEDDGGEVQTAQTGGLAAADPAFNLLVRAADAQQRTGHAAKGSGTREVMQRLDPAFDLGRLGYSSFKAFVKAAADAGYVTVAEPQGLDMEISAKIAPLRVLQNALAPASDSFQYDSDSSAFDSYCRILRDTIKVPLIPWVEREDLVRYLVSQMAGAPEGLTRKQVKDVLQHRAEEKGFLQPVRALEKLTQTLSIAECFRKNGKSGSESGNPVRLHMAADADAALERLHARYLAGILGVDSEAKLRPIAVAKLIFDSGEPAHVKQAKSLITETRKKAAAKREIHTTQ